MTQAEIDSLIEDYILIGNRRTKGVGVRSLLQEITRQYANLTEGGEYNSVLKYAESVDITDYQDLVTYGFVDANYASLYDFDALSDYVYNLNPSATWGSITGTLTDQTDLITYLNSTHEKLSNKGIAGGYAPLNGSTKIDAAYLPSYVDDVEEYANFASFPVTGETGKIYIAIDTTNQYRWSGSAYVQITNSSAVWGNISGTITNQTDLITYLSTNYQPLNSNLTNVNTIYARLDGANQPFTGNVNIEKAFTGGVGQLRVRSTSGNSSIQFESLAGAGNTVLDLLSVSNDTYFRMFRGSYSTQVMEMLGGSGTTTITSGSGNRNMTISSTGTGFLKLKGNHGGANGNEINFGNGNGVSVVTQQLFYAQNDGDTNRMQWTASTSELKLRLSSVDRIIFNPNSQNSGIFNNGIKFANNTDSAATAGGGSFKYSGGLAYYSDGSNWLQLATGTAGTTDYEFGFSKHGALSYQVIQADGYDAAYTNSMGFVVPINMTLKEITVILGDSSASASETLTFTIRKLAVGVGNTGSVSAYTIAAGTSVTSISFASGGVLAARYYRNQVTTGLSVSLSAGDVLFCESSNFAFWTANDVKVRLRCQL